MPAALAIPVAKAVAKKATAAVVGALGLTGSDPETDEHRIQTTRQVHDKVMTGDIYATAWLRARAGHGGTINIPGYGSVGGWGSGPAKAYAAELWSALSKDPARQSQIERAKALWTNQSTGAAVTSTLTQEVGGTGIPMWVLLLGAAVLIAGVIWWRSR